MEFKYNQDWKLRDSMLNDVYGERKSGDYDVYRFDGVTAETLQKLVDLKFADPNEQQNEAPTIGQFLEFLNDNPDFTAHGYAVTVKRDDYRISLEGVVGEAYDVETFRFADDFQIRQGFQYAWYD